MGMWVEWRTDNSYRILTRKKLANNIKVNPRKIYFQYGRSMLVAQAHVRPFAVSVVQASDFADKVLGPLPKPSSYKYICKSPQNISYERA
jgi:hypothetical protein